MGVAWVGVPRVGEGVDSQNGSRRTTAAWASRSSYSGWEAGPVCQAGEAGHVRGVPGEFHPDGLINQAYCRPGRPRCPEIAMRYMRAI